MEDNGWFPPLDAVLKIHIGDTEIRRINAVAISDPKGIDIYQVLLRKITSFVRLSDFVGEFSTVQTNEIKTFYTDEDGDLISFSSEAEFLDAWKKFLERGEGNVFCVKAVVRKNMTIVSPNFAESIADKKIFKTILLRLENLEKKVLQLSPTKNSVTDNFQNLLGELARTVEKIPSEQDKMTSRRIHLLQELVSKVKKVPEGSIDHTAKGKFQELFTELVSTVPKVASEQDKMTCSRIHLLTELVTKVQKVPAESIDHTAKGKFQELFTELVSTVPRVPSEQDKMTYSKIRLLNELVSKVQQVPPEQNRTTCGETYSATTNMRKFRDLLKELLQVVEKVLPEEEKKRNDARNEKLLWMQLRSQEIQKQLKNKCTLLAKYFKMLRVGLPLSAVQHSMTRDGVDPATVEKFPFQKQRKKPKKQIRRKVVYWPTVEEPNIGKNSVWSTVQDTTAAKMKKISESEPRPNPFAGGGIAAAAAAAAAAAKHKKNRENQSRPNPFAGGGIAAAAAAAAAAKNKKNSVAGRHYWQNDPEHEKYLKMLNVGIPVGAVQHAMVRDGLDPTVWFPVRSDSSVTNDDGYSTSVIHSRNDTVPIFGRDDDDGEIAIPLAIASSVATESESELRLHQEGSNDVISTVRAEESDSDDWDILDDSVVAEQIESDEELARAAAMVRSAFSFAWE